MKKEKCPNCKSNKTDKIVGEETYVCLKCKSFFTKQKEEIKKEEEGVFDIVLDDEMTEQPPSPKRGRPKKAQVLIDEPKQPVIFCKYCGNGCYSEEELRLHIGSVHPETIKI